MEDHATTHRTAFDDVWREHRAFLVDVAFRMLGNIGDAEDTVQEAFLRLLASDLDGIEEVRGWLVVVVSRLCLDRLRSARSRKDGHLDDSDTTPVMSAPERTDPADRVTLDDSVRLALVVVLEQLSPAERTAFVLHDVFRFSFDEVAAVVGRSPAACRQLASRARRRVAGSAGPSRFLVEPADEHRVTEQFIAACAGGDVRMLMELLDPEVVGYADLGPDVPARAQRGATTVAGNVLRFFGSNTGTTLVSHSTDGRPGALAFRGRELAAVILFKTREGRIYDIHAVADPSRFAALGVGGAPVDDLE